MIPFSGAYCGKQSTGFPQYAHPLYARFVRVFHNVHSNTTTTGLFFHN